MNYIGGKGILAQQNGVTLKDKIYAGFQRYRFKDDVSIRLLGDYAADVKFSLAIFYEALQRTSAVFLNSPRHPHVLCW